MRDPSHDDQTTRRHRASPARGASSPQHPPRHFQRADTNPHSTHAGSAPTTSRGTHVAAVALGALLVCSCSLNVAQFVGGARGVSEGASLGQAPALGWGASLPKTHAFARMEDPLIDGRCNNGLVHMCIDDASAASSATAASASRAASLGQVPVQVPVSVVAATAAASAANDPLSVAAADNDGIDTFRQSGAEPGQVSVTPAEQGGDRYCRKDTWLLSCLFYKADVNDELTDWKSVKSECDREPLCDGVNKYWTSDLWHISSSGEAPGCDDSLSDGYGTDASAFYKENSPGWNVYTQDKSCREVDEWGNPFP